VDFNSAGMDKLKLDFDTEINLYRIVQEGLNNIMKHADANQVIIKLVASFPKIILRIADDGKGFNVKDRSISAFNEKRMGLLSIKERVNLLGGKMRIKSHPKGGTKILIEAPFKKQHLNR
jgi:signal transduction histidine kinase